MDRLGAELNNTGKEKAVEQVKLLTKIPEYRKKSSPDQALLIQTPKNKRVYIEMIPLCLDMCENIAAGYYVVRSK